MIGLVLGLAIAAATTSGVQHAQRRAPPGEPPRTCAEIRALSPDERAYWIGVLGITEADAAEIKRKCFPPDDRQRIRLR